MVRFLCWEEQLGVFRLELVLTVAQRLVGVRMLVGVRPVLPSSRVLKLRMPLLGVSMVTPSMFLTVTGVREREAGLWGLAVARRVDGDPLYVLDGDGGEGEGGRSLGLGCCWLHQDWRLALRFFRLLHLDLESTGLSVGRQDVLQLLLLLPESGHLLLQTPVLHLPLADLHLQVSDLVQSLLPALGCCQPVPVPPHLPLGVLLRVQEVLLSP